MAGFVAVATRRGRRYNNYVIDTQLYLAVGIPSALFALNFTAILAAALWQARRFDDLKDVFRSEMGRVEGILRNEAIL